MLKYPLLCPACKRGYLKLEKGVFRNVNGTISEGWVCEKCGFALQEDNPSERSSKRNQKWDEAWDVLMS